MVTTAREGRRRCELQISSGTRHKFAAEALRDGRKTEGMVGCMEFTST